MYTNSFLYALLFRNDYMSSVTINGKVRIDISGLENMAGKIKSVSVSTLQTQIRSLAESILREILASDYPARSTPWYTGTGEMADAVMVEGSGTNLHIWIDGSRLSMAITPEDMFNINASIKGEDFRQGLPVVLNDGGGGIVSHDGTYYMERAYAQYKARFVHILASALRGAGFDVSEG